MIRGSGAAPTSFFLLSSIKSLFLSAAVLVFAVGPASAQLSQNSGIRSNDTWVTLDLTMQIQAPSSSISRPTITYTHHVEIGYDMNGQIVANLWPTGDSGVPSDLGEISVIRVSGGSVTLFDQDGAPIPWVAPIANLPEFNPLNLLGSNPGASILSNLVVLNMQTQAQKTNSQLSYNGSYAVLWSEQTSGTTQWTYAPSGNVYVATQVTFSINKPNLVKPGYAPILCRFTRTQFHPLEDPVRRTFTRKAAVSGPPLVMQAG